jgi:hypothetical protein
MSAIFTQLTCLVRMPQTEMRRRKRRRRRKKKSL